MYAVHNDRYGDIVVSEYRTRKPRIPMMQGRHRIPKMCRGPYPFAKSLHSLMKGRGAMSRAEQDTAFEQQTYADVVHYLGGNSHHFYCPAVLAKKIIDVIGRRIQNKFRRVSAPLGRIDRKSVV